ncbi:MAG TPA: DUF488 domain-containing protein [Acidimicrobiales bacterium]|nr:DUF488 domain-containing protein [Acidimicrobiales bacterium]
MTRVDRGVAPDAQVMLTVGHGTQSAEDFTGLVLGAEVGAVVDVRSFPGSRRHPHFSRTAMEEWLVDAGVAYRWEPALGGFRRPRADSPNTALRHPSALAGSLVPTTLAGHRFWEETDKQERAAQQIHFLKNLSMLGGLMLAALDTEGRPSATLRVRHAVRRMT